MTTRASSTRTVRKMVSKEFRKGTPEGRKLAASNMGSCQRKKRK